jgi:hypothetical protein
MREAHTRNRAQLGDIDGDGYANYINIEQCAQDFYLYLKAKNYDFADRSPAEYANWLYSKSYFEDSLENYSTALINWYNKA